MMIMHYNDYNALQYKTPHIQWMCNSYNGLQWCQCITMKEMVYNENLTHEMNVQWKQYILCITMITMVYNDNNGIQ